MSQNNILRQIRTEQNIGQSELARKAGVSKQLIWGFENGKNGISPQVLRKISEILKVEPNHIINQEKEKRAFGIKQKDKLAQAIKFANEFYKDYDFDSEMIAKISTELYSFMVDFDSLKAEMASDKFDKSLDDKIASGLAARCFLNIKGKI